MRVLLGGAALVALSLAWATSALALDVDQDEALRLRQSGEVLSFQAILRQADERYPGARLLEAELDDDDGEFIYEIELLTGDGVVRELEIDARTGRVLEDEVDNCACCWWKTPSLWPTSCCPCCAITVTRWTGWRTAATPWYAPTTMILTW